MKWLVFSKGRGWKKGKKLKKYNFDSKSPLLDVGGFAKQDINKYSPYDHKINQ
jgi:hypothetical protein